MKLRKAILGGAFPLTYREFLQTLGAGSFGAFEAYGIIDEDFESAPVLNGIRLNLD